MAAQLLFAVLLIAACVPARTAVAEHPDEAARAAFAETLSRLLQDAIPREYDKRKDWGATREITAGYRVEGKPFHLHVHRRKRSVNHGVWKHYRIRVVEPERSLRLQLRDLQPLAGGRLGFTLVLDARLDAWCRAKIYQYGVHLGAFEIEGDTQLHLQIRGDVALQAVVAHGAVAFAVQPRIHEAMTSVEEFRIRRVSNADGPIVRELSQGARSLLEDELNGPRFTTRLNEALHKQQDRLVLAPAELAATPWRMLSAAD